MVAIALAGSLFFSVDADAGSLVDGVPVTTVAQLLGHANPTLVTKTYAHYIPGYEAAVRDLFEERLTSG